MELSTFYQLLPGKNCGLCDYGSCNTFARHIVFGNDDVRKCAWLSKDDIQHIQVLRSDVDPVRTRVGKDAVFSPCILDREMVMAEFYLASQEVDYGYLDPGFCEALSLYFDGAKCSEILGIGRIECEGKKVLISQTGKIIVRQAETEQDAVSMCDLLSRITSGSVICSCFATGIECVSGLCTCTQCEVLHRAQNGSDSIRELMTSLTPYENAVKTALSRIWDGEPLHVLDTTPLKMRAVSLLSETMEGLIWYSLADHLSLMQEAIEDAYKEKEKENEIKDSITFEEWYTGNYQGILDYCKKRAAHPFFRELYKAAFHARCIVEIKSLHF